MMRLMISFTLLVVLCTGWTLAAICPRARPTITGSTVNGKHRIQLDARDSTGDIDSYKWKLLNGPDSGKTVKAARVDYSFTTPGNYIWKVTICEGRRCSSERVNMRFYTDATQKQTLPPSVEASMKTSTTGTEHTMLLDASTSTTQDGTVTYLWKMLEGDDTSFESTEGTVEYITNNHGLYSWRVIVCDGNAVCADTVLETNFKHIEI